MANLKICSLALWLCALLAQSTSARFILPDLIPDLITADDNDTATLLHELDEHHSSSSFAPECAGLDYPANQDPEWDYETASEAKCHCWPGKDALLHCEATIPNDHVFDRRDIEIEPRRCGRSVYMSVNRGVSAKSARICMIGNDNVAHLTWKNGIGTPMKTIQAGWEKGTCGAFPEVRCSKGSGG